MIDFLVFGAGGHAKVIYDAALKEGRHRVCGFVVDNHDQGPDASFLGAPLFRFDEMLRLRAKLPRSFMVAIGDNAVRQTKTELMESYGFQPISVVHPFSSIAYDAEIGAGVLVCAAAVIDPGVTIGDGTIINGGAAVGHESRIGRFTHISGASYVGANCFIDDLTFVAMRATVISGVSVGRNTFIGAGALVTKEVPADVAALGSPARYRSRGTVLTPDAGLPAMMPVAPVAV